MPAVQEAIKRLRYVYTSEGADKVAADYNRVVVQSQSAERAVLSQEKAFASIERRYNQQIRAQHDYEKVQRQVNAAVAANPALQQRANDVLARAAAQLKGVSVANDNVAKSTGLARHELVNLSRQAQDIGVSLASGQSPFTVLIQQGTQVADIFGTSQGTVRGFGAQLASLVTPMRLLVAGVALVGAAAVAATVSWRSFALALDDTAKQAGITSSEMAKLQAAASFKGISNDDFAKAMGAFSQNVYEAKNNMGGLADVFRANGSRVTDFQSALERSADLIKNASSDQQRLVLLQQMGLPATMQWVRLMSQGAEGIRKAKDETVAFGGAANDNMIAKARAFDEAWNRTATNFGRYWRGAIVDVAGFFDGLSDKATALLMKIPGIGRNVPTNLLKDALASGAAGSRLTQGQADTFYDAVTPRFRVNGQGNTTDPNALKQQLALEQQRIGVLGQLASVEDQIRQKQIEIQTARLNGIRVTKAEEQAILSLARAQADGTLQMRAMADSARIEMQTLGMSTAAATEYRLVQERLNEAKRTGQSVSADTVAAWQREARAAGEAMQALERAREIQSAAIEVTTSFARDFKSQLRDGADAWDAFRNAGAKALDSIADKLMDMAIKNLVGQAFGGASGGGGLGGILSSVFGGGGNPTGFATNPWSSGGLLASANGNAFDQGNVIPFARGGIVDRPTLFPMANGAGLMGEAGPEAVMPLRRGPDGRLGVQAAGGSSVTVHLGGNTIVIKGNADGATVEALKAELDRRDRALLSKVPETVRQAQSRRVLG